jgi:hypothetical protein
MRLDRWRLTDAVVTVAACSVGLAFVAIVVPQPLPPVLTPSGMAFPAYIGMDPRALRPVTSPSELPTDVSSKKRAGSRPDDRNALSRPETMFWAMTNWSLSSHLAVSQQTTGSHGGPAPAPGHGTSPPPGSGTEPSPVPAPQPTTSPTQRPAPTSSSPSPTATETSPPPPTDSSPPPTDSPSPPETTTDPPPPEETSTPPPPPTDSSGG